MKRQQGLSLIELMIAILISSLLLLGVLQLFTDTNSADRSSTALARVQESGRILMEIIGTDARRAGYQGCSASANTVTVDTLKFPADAIGFANKSVTFRHATKDSFTVFLDADGKEQKVNRNSFANNSTCDGQPLFLKSVSYFNCLNSDGVCMSTDGTSEQQLANNTEITAIDFGITQGGKTVWKESAAMTAAEIDNVKSVRISLSIEDTREDVLRTYSSTFELRNRIL